MNKKLRWGILSTANIGIKQVIPAMQRAGGTEITAIASRDLYKAKSTAKLLGIEKPYGSYEELLKDSSIDAVYIPVPNHLHVDMTLKALEHGKHVLCEKPFTVKASDLEQIDKAQKKTGLVVGEAFMVLHHPRWKRVREIIASGVVGTLEHIQGYFSFFNTDPDNIRNKPELGGGSVYDIGVYPNCYLALCQWRGTH
jgi:predicted dehydrogenase